MVVAVRAFTHLFCAFLLSQLLAFTAHVFAQGFNNVELVHWIKPNAYSINGGTTNRMTEYILVLSNYPDFASHTPNGSLDIHNRPDVIIASTNHNRMFKSGGKATNKSQKFQEVCTYLRWRYLGFMSTLSTLAICGGSGTDMISAFIGASSATYIDKFKEQRDQAVLRFDQFVASKEWTVEVLRDRYDTQVEYVLENMLIMRLMMASDTRLRLLDYADSIPALVAEEKRLAIAARAEKIAMVEETPPLVQEVIPDSLEGETAYEVDEEYESSDAAVLDADKEAFLTSVLEP